jgi:outer membrane protein assembly factor BamE (lipoprotein component of BamABCDE complex)
MRRGTTISQRAIIRLATGRHMPGCRARRAARVAIALLTGTLAACSSTVTKHGHHFQETDLQQIQPGMSQEQVRTSLGTPATTASAGTGNAYYYISSTMKQTAFFTPSEVDRRVVAVYFSRSGAVERVAEYGLKDGKIFDFVSRTTPSANTNDEGLVKQLFRNLGKKGSLFGE